MAGAATEFDPAVHGFQFRNRFNGLDVLSEINDGLGEVARAVSGSQDFWEGWGLCGGMSWHALDRFYTRNPVPTITEIPGGGSPLFRILALRQFDSFRGAFLLTKCLRWQTRNEEKPWWDLRPTILALTLREWAKVQQSIDWGAPAPLTLIRTTTDPSKNHQVVAVSYEGDRASGTGELALYDPNRPGQTPRIKITLAGPDAGKASQTSGERLRGFFLWPYDRTERPRPAAHS